MKKLMIGVLSLAFASCMTAAISLTSNDASAQETQNTSIFTETKCQISKSGDKMLMVTGITDVSRVYEVGYDISGGYQLSPSDIAETNMYYESLTLGSTTKTAGEFLAGAQGLLIWEVAYNSAYTYTVQPYAYLGEFNNAGQLIAPENETKSYGAVKANFNQVTVTFADQDGTVISTQNVNIGATATSIAAPEKAGAEFLGWYVNGTAYDFGQKVTKDMTITAKYKTAASYAVKVTTAQYNVKYSNTYYYPNALSYVDSTSDFASYLGINANGIGTAMSGTTIDLTEAVKNLPEGVKLNNESVLTGVVEEDGSLELNVKLDFDEDYLGFKISQISFGVYGNSDNVLLSLAMKNGVVGLAVDGMIGNGSGLCIDVDADASLTPSLMLRYFEKDSVTTWLEVKDEEGKFVSAGTILTAAPTAGVYYGSTFNVFEKTSLTKIKGIKIKVSNPSNQIPVRNMFIAGLKALTYEETVKSKVYDLINGNLADVVSPIALGTMSQASAYHWNALGKGKDSVVYNFAGNTPGNQYYRIGVSLNLGAAIRVSDYESINVLFQTTSQKQVDDSFNAGTAVYINGTIVTPLNADGSHSIYYNGQHLINLIAMAKENNIDTIKSVVIAHADWSDRKNVSIYIGQIEMIAAPLTGSFNADNGLANMTTAIAGTLSTEEKTFTTADGTSFTQMAVAVKYHNPDKKQGYHTSGLIIDLGDTIFVSKYKSIKFAFASETDCGGSTIIFFNDQATEIASYTSNGVANVVDLVALAKAKKVTSFSQVELSMSSWANVRSLDIYVAYLIFELA